MEDDRTRQRISRNKFHKDVLLLGKASMMGKITRITIALLPHGKRSLMKQCFRIKQHINIHNIRKLLQKVTDNDMKIIQMYE